VLKTLRQMLVFVIDEIDLITKEGDEAKAIGRCKLCEAPVVITGPKEEPK
jgi:hypothetical protein